MKKLKIALFALLTLFIFSIGYTQTHVELVEEGDVCVLVIAIESSQCPPGQECCVEGGNDCSAGGSNGGVQQIVLDAREYDECE